MEAAVIESVHSLAGMRLVHVCCEAEILDFQFDSLTLHAIGCSRIIRQGEILVTVPDYRSWDGLESTRNSEWFNLKRFQTKLTGGRGRSADLYPWRDRRVTLDNGVLIECLIANARPHYGEEQEQQVLFEPWEDRGGTGAFLTPFNRRMEFHGRTAAFQAGTGRTFCAE